MRGIRLKIQNLGKKIKIREGGRERERKKEPEEVKEKKKMIQTTNNY